MSDPKALRLRAAWVPLGSVGRLEDLNPGLRAAALSLGDATATHLLVVADELPAALAASASRAGGRLLYALPDGTAFAEGCGELPSASAGGLSLRLSGHPDPFVFRGTLEPVERFLDVRWTEPVPAPPPPEIPRSVVRLEASSDPRPVLAVISRRIDLDATMRTLPEARLAGISFSAGEEGVVLLAATAGLLDGIAGEAFHRLTLEDGRSLYLPLGAVLVPECAASSMGRLLGKEGDHFFWRGTGLRSLRSADLAPLTRRAWYEVARVP